MKPVTDPAILAQLSGGGEGPKPVTDPAILAQLNAGAPVAAAPERLGSISPEFNASTMGGVARGMADPIAGLAQFAAHALDPVEAGLAAVGLDKYLPRRSGARDDLDAKIAASERQYQGDRAAVGQTGFDGGRLAGNLLSPITLAGGGAMAAMRGVGTAGKIAAGAASGVAGSAMQPVTDTSRQPYLPQKGEQMVTGALAGAALPFGGLLLKGAKDMVPAVLGNLTTGAGANSIREAFRAGKAGGAAADAFKGSMRGDIPWSQVVDDAKSALGNMRADRGAAYRSGMADISKDRQILDFAPVDAAMMKTEGVKTFKGQDLSPKTADVRSEIASTIDGWKQLDPAEYHTPEGFDALKQKVKDIRDSLPFNTPQRVVADNAYNAIRAEIANQAPGYDKVMKDYGQASDLIDTIQKEMSLGPKGNPNTALRKLQSVMRDNVNTSFGDRTKFADQLTTAGASQLMPSLAGQALSSMTPRGLSKIGAGADLALAAFHNPAALAALPLTSPRAVGEMAYGMGAGARVANELLPSGVPIPRFSLSPMGGLVAPPLLLQPSR